MASSNGITQRQVWAYWRAFGLASAALGLGAAEREEYRHRAMMEECGKGSVKDLDRTGDFDAIMARFLSDAGDYAQASRYAIGDAVRLVRMVESAAAQLSQLQGTLMTDAAAYVAGILRKAGYRIAAPVRGTYWMDIAQSDLFAVFQMLDTHRRRLIKRHGLADGSISTFGVHISYRLQPCGLVESVISDPPRDYFRVADR